MSIATARYIVRRTALSAIAIGGLMAGAAAVAAAASGVAHPGVVSGPPGESVIEVSPTGYAWRNGIRPGQIVDVMSAIDDPNGWRIETHDGVDHYVALASVANDALAGTLPIAVAGLIAGFLAVLFLRTRRRWVLPAASVAILAASIPLGVEGRPDMSTLGMAGSALLPAGALALRLPVGRRVQAIVVGSAFLAIVAWATLRLMGLDVPRTVEDLRGGVALWATVGLVFDRTVLPALAGERIHVTRPRLFDITVIGATAVTALVLMAVGVSAVIVALILVAATVAVPVTRRRFARPIEDALFGDVRELAAAEAAEAERARLARELHDAPLQELAAVIRRLEIVPGAETEREHLRALAGHLRNVATELRPPVLDDLGLPAALEFLAEDATSAAVPVTAELTDRTGFGAGRRPPPVVELAMYRIASEAVGNAVRHSGGTAVRIRAGVAPDRIDLSVTDDGGGLDPAAARDATRHRRLGLASMRRRAEAIDAELSIDGEARGTEVRVTWRA